MKSKKQFKYIPSTVSISSFQRESGKIIDRVKESNQPYFIIRNNKPEAVILTTTEYERLKRAADNYEGVADVMQSMEELRQGKVKVLKSLRDLV